MRILLIEPNQLLAKVYMSALTRAGHSVVVSGHAQWAVDKVDEQTPDVVLLELQLPGHSGVEFLYEFRSYPEWAAIPIVLHTFVPPHQLQVQTDVFDQLGVVEYLYKPATSLDKLIRSIDSVLQRAA